MDQTDQNPSGIGLLQLMAEDFRTHDRNPMQAGFWAIAVHRLGNARLRLGSRLLRAPLDAAYRVLDTGVNWVWGIDLPCEVKVGRRVRIWHHGGIVIRARGIGDDVHIRHNTTIGPAGGGDPHQLPTVGNRVDMGAGACILGAVMVGDDSVIGANTVVLRDVAEGSTMFGVPARPVNLRDAKPPPALKSA